MHCTYKVNPLDSPGCIICVSLLCTNPPTVVPDAVPTTSYSPGQPSVDIVTVNITLVSYGSGSEGS